MLINHFRLLKRFQEDLLEVGKFILRDAEFFVEGVLKELVIGEIFPAIMSIHFRN